ncbi:MAG: Lrp/AsnC family transcriptional regulator [Oscillospiraceae bacterium]|jgi:DNA-binding Lrp family transcriptional regulator|nr:Lrp/AsnC family transcriptional regulator [Oscillospiraceae bacterium]
MNEILSLLEKDSGLSPREISEITGVSEEEVAEIIARAERDGTILKYSAVVDWDKVPGGSAVMALIEVKITPQRGAGYDRIAERILRYEEVESLYLMAGAYDLACLVRANTMREISEFVFAHLAAIEGVTSTSTHFIMKRYKEKHSVFEKEQEQEERGLFT